MGFPELDDMSMAYLMQIMQTLGLLNEFDEFDHSANL
jgi:hypothetical protein